MPAKTEKQARFFRWLAHDPKAREKKGVSLKTAREFERTDADEVCAGVLIASNRGRYLLLRGDDGEWTQPGGHAHPGESMIACARRETREETGFDPAGAMPFRVSRGNGVVFTAFRLDGIDEFDPVKDRGSRDEWDRFGWFEPAQLPDAVHPEVARSIAIAEGTDTDVARAMVSDGVLSPQRVANAVLFDVRITGTGTAYRRALDEYVYRPPENYLTDEFVNRCAGLPVIMEHPDGGTLDGDALHEQIAGTIILPYIKGSEVWGIARILDMDAAKAMMTTHLSTSPAVGFRESSGTTSRDLDDGSTLLIEGVPSYLDHLAICVEGVWDKNGAPRGINETAQQAITASA